MICNLGIYEYKPFTYKNEKLQDYHKPNHFLYSHEMKNGNKLLNIDETCGSSLKYGIQKDVDYHSAK